MWWLFFALVYLHNFCLDKIDSTKNIPTVHILFNLRIILMLFYSDLMKMNLLRNYTIIKSTVSIFILNSFIAIFITLIKIVISILIKWIGVLGIIITIYLFIKI